MSLRIRVCCHVPGLKDSFFLVIEDAKETL